MDEESAVPILPEKASEGLSSPFSLKKSPEKRASECN